MFLRQDLRVNCQLGEGLVCLNDQNPSGCQDYAVQFLCEHAVVFGVGEWIDNAGKCYTGTLTGFMSNSTTAFSIALSDHNTAKRIGTALVTPTTKTAHSTQLASVMVEWVSGTQLAASIITDSAGTAPSALIFDDGTQWRSGSCMFNKRVDRPAAAIGRQKALVTNSYSPTAMPSSNSNRSVTRISLAMAHPTGHRPCRLHCSVAPRPYHCCL